MVHGGHLHPTTAGIISSSLKVSLDSFTSKLRLSRGVKEQRESFTAVLNKQQMNFVHRVKDRVYPDFSMAAVIQLLKNSIFVFVHVNKHYIPKSETGKSPYPGFEKPDLATWSTLKENGTLWHVNALTRFPTAADYLHRRGLSQVTYKKNKQGNE